MSLRVINPADPFLWASPPQWTGVGVPYEDVAADGDSGASPVLDDGISAGHEYRIEVVTPPSAGTLTLYPDLSFTFADAPDGVYTWTYRLYEDGVADATLGTVSMAVGSAGAVEMQAAGVSVSTGTGQPAVAVAASAIGVGVTDGAAGMTATVTITAAGLVEAAGNAGLTVSSDGSLMANGVAVPSGAAALSVLITLQATDGAESAGSAAIVSGAGGALSGAGGAQADGGALVALTVQVSAAGFVQAMSAGALTVSAPLSAFGPAQAGGAAALVNLSAVGPLALVAGVRRLIIMTSEVHRVQ